jgi:hypothetical protein
MKRLSTFFITLLLAGQAFAEPALKPFLCTEGRFSVQLPGNPTASVEDHGSFLGNVRTHQWIVDTSTSRYTASYTDVPGIAVSIARGTMFSKSRDGLLERTHGTEVTFRDLDYPRHNARELIYSIPAQGGHSARNGRAWFVLCGHRMIVVDSRVDAGLDRVADSVLHSLVADLNDKR